MAFDRAETSGPDCPVIIISGRHNEFLRPLLSFCPHSISVSRSSFLNSCLSVKIDAQTVSHKAAIIKSSSTALQHETILGRDEAN